MAWSADAGPPLVDNEFEIFAQRLSGSGALLGGRIRVSYMGPNGSVSDNASSPSVAHDAVDDQWLIAWSSDDNTPPLVALELAAKRIAARGPLKIRIVNANTFAVTVRLAARAPRRATVARKRQITLKTKPFAVAAQARRTVALKLPKLLRQRLQRTGRLRLRLTARLADPAGSTRTIHKRVAPRLKTPRRAR